MTTTRDLGPSIMERKAHVLRRVDLRALLKNSRADFKTNKDSERVACPLCGAGGFATARNVAGVRVWRCYGGACGSGNAIDFVMKRDKADFMTALRSLERDHGGLASFTPERRAELERRRAAEEKRAAEDEAKRREDAAMELSATIARMAPITPDTLAWQYLEDRGLDMAKLAPMLSKGACGFVPDARHPEDPKGKRRPALIVVVTKMEGGVMRTTVAMQAIFLDPIPQPAPPAFVKIYNGPRDGRGATQRIWRPRGLKNAKITTGFWQHGACRAMPLPAHGELGLAEGFEKSLAVTQLYGIPCWPVMYAQNFKTCLIGAEAISLKLFVDNNRPRLDPFTGELRDKGGVSFEAAQARKLIDPRVTGILRPPVSEDYSDLLVLWRAGLVDDEGRPRVSREELAKALGAV
jgi:hypothetical protein